ncbi:hypothetical protein E4U32_004473 [Claviceps aff. humidiphila group G2b]|nr:hypothetical protein E4U32_004473 [Claviceps aff. humidiphila group G2b]
MKETTYRNALAKSDGGKDATMVSDTIGDLLQAPDRGGRAKPASSNRMCVEKPMASLQIVWSKVYQTRRRE